jgi:hypothetical protein
MDCIKCKHLIAGTCEIYEDSLPVDSDDCEYKDEVEGGTLGMSLELPDKVPSLVGISIEEELTLQMYERGTL